jgi:hypothetical protein
MAPASILAIIRQGHHYQLEDLAESDLVQENCSWFQSNIP